MAARFSSAATAAARADAQHLAAELVGRYLKNRQGLAAIALTTDTSILTAVANDFGYDQVFRRQVEALGCPGDCLVGISTSGRSSNIVEALKEAKARQMRTVVMVGDGLSPWQTWPTWSCACPPTTRRASRKPTASWATSSATWWNGPAPSRRPRPHAFPGSVIHAALPESPAALGRPGRRHPRGHPSLVKRKRTRIAFSSLRFLEAMEPRTLRWLRLRQRLLLILRTLLLLLAALPWPDPSGSPQGREGGRDRSQGIAVVLDQTQSLRAGRRWPQAQRHARSLLARWGGSVTRWIGMGDPTQSPASDEEPGLLSARINAAEPTWQGGDWRAAWREALQTGAGALALISDFQAPVSPLPADSLCQAFDGDLFCARTGEALGNRAVLDFRLDSKIWDPGGTLRVSAVVANFQDMMASGVRVRLTVNGEALAQETVDLLPGERKTVPFALSRSIASETAPPRIRPRQRRLFRG